MFPIFDFNRPIYVLCRHHTFPRLGERCNYGVEKLISHHVRYQKQILLLKMALIFPPMLNIYIPDFWFQKAYLCFMSTSYVSMTGRKMQLCCRKLNFPPSSVPKTDPPAEYFADISTNVEYICSRFLLSIGLAMFYVDIIRFHDWEKDAIMVSKT